MKRLLIYLLCAMAAGSCVYPIDIPIEESREFIPVIEGHIVIGATSYVRLSQMMGFGSTSTGLDASDATVTLEGEDGTVINGTRTYTTFYFDTKSADASVSYRVRTQWKGNVYTTPYTLPSDAPAITSLVFDVDDNNVNVLLSLNGGDGGFGYAMVSYEEIWRFHVDYLRIFEYDPEENTISTIMEPDMSHYTCWNKYSSSGILLDYSNSGGIIDSYPVVRFPRSNYRNHETYRILVKVRNLTKQEYAYRKRLEEQGSTAGDLFIPEPGEMAGNIKCENEPSAMVLGYVNYSRQDTFTSQIDGRYYIFGGKAKLETPEPEEYLEYYYRGYRPVDMQDGKRGWGTPSCYDCVAAGGTLTEPSFTYLP